MHLFMATCILLVLLSLYIFSCYKTDKSYTPSEIGKDFNTYLSDYFQLWSGYDVKRHSSLSADIPIIVWWSRAGSLNPHGLSKSGPSYARLTCPNGASCYSTIHRSPKIMSDIRTRGILFYGSDFEPIDLPLPRLKHHEWAIIHEESPLNNYILTHYPMIRLFNHTATFKRDSDYPLSTQYIPMSDYFLNRKPVSTPTKNEEKKSRGLAPVVYVQSHCDTPSDRDSFVKEFMKYIAVDSYGACLHNKNLPPNLLEPAATFEHPDFLDLLSVYKFNLAFENAYCDDYMTEKIMRPLHVGVVPIYKGSPVVQDWMPNNHTVIYVDRFSSPKELADFIKYLDNNDEEYDKYLEFKHERNENKFFLEHMSKREWSAGETQSDFFRGFECYLCKQLQDRMDAEKVHARNQSSPLMPPRIAQSSHLSCPAPERLDVGWGIKEYWPEIDWTAMYWDELDSARTVQRMLEVGETDSKQFSKYLFEEREKYRSKPSRELR